MAASTSPLAPTTAHGRRATIPSRSHASKPSRTSATVASAPSSRTANDELVSSREECTSHLDDDRQHHRPAAQALVDELGEVVVQDLLEQVRLADLLLGRARERPLDRLADV